MDSTSILTSPVYSFMPGNIYYYSTGPGAQTAATTTVQPVPSVAADPLVLGLGFGIVAVVLLVLLILVIQEWLDR